MALVARETPISQVSGPPIVSAVLKGADAVVVAGGNVVSEYWLMSRPEIKTAEQLKGGSVAIATFGGQADFISRIALQKLGLTSGKDVAIVQVGTVPERLSALQSGKVQAAMLNVPDNVTAQKRGFNSLVSLRLPYQGVGVSTTRTFIRENPDLVRKYVKSQIEAVHRIKTDRELGLKVLAKYLSAPDKEILERSYDDISSDEKVHRHNTPVSKGSKTFWSR
jgi:ABC-type nitrate/sulfonate/bicarbonate transport system substrate-binding protein